MIRKLKLKFIIINMIFAALVLSIAFAAVYVSTEQRLVGDNESILKRMLMQNDGQQPPKKELGGHQTGDKTVSIPAFSVMLDKGNNITKVSGELYDLSNETALEQIVKVCLQNSGAGGIIAGENLRYLKQATDFGMKIAFVDREMESSTLSSLVTTSIFVGFGSLLFFLLVHIYLARWALRPVEKAWQQQKQFVADASHELKTPLTVILANAGIVLAHKQDTVLNQAKWIEYIQTEATRMTSLVNNLLFLAKTDDSNTKAGLSTINLSDTVWSALLPFEPLLYEQDKRLESDILPNLFIKGDENKLRQLVAILLDNACKYSEQGGTVTVKLGIGADGKAVLSVKNTGKPIEQEHLSHIFERFYRADPSRSREQGGYGLGLAIAYSITALHNGKISVHSTEHGGTTFTVMFPGVCVENKE